MLIFSRLLLALNLFLAIISIILIAYQLTTDSLNSFTLGFGSSTLLFNLLIAYLAWTNWNDIDKCLTIM
jgi:hypothetical protein